MPVFTDYAVSKPTTLSDMLGNLNTLQQYQQAQQLNPLQLEKARLELEQARAATPTSVLKSKIEGEVAGQTNEERKALMEFHKNPENWSTNGRIDLDKINSTIPKIAPLTGRDALDKLTALGKAQTDAIEGKRNLTQKGREIISDRMGVLGRAGITDPKFVTSELDRLKNENPDDKDLHRVIDAYKVPYSMTPPGEHVTQDLIRSSQSMLSPSQQQESLTPKAELYDVGGEFRQKLTTPSVAGSTPSVQLGEQLGRKTLAPGQTYEATGRVDPENNPTAYVKDQYGKILGEVTIPAGVQATPANPAAPNAPSNAMPPPSAILPPNLQKPPVTPVTNTPVTNAPARLPAYETSETLTNARNTQLAANQAAQGVNQTQFNNNQIIKLADEAITGKGAQAIANLGGGYAAIPFTFDAASNLQQLGHYMSLETANLAKSSGLGTDAARGIASQVSGTTEWTKDSIKSTARINRALSTGTDLFNQGINNSIKLAKNNPLAGREFSNKWSSMSDVNTLRLMDAVRNKDNEEIRGIVDSVGGPNSKRYKELLLKAETLNNLVKGVQ